MGAGKIDGQMDFLGLIEEYTDDQGAIVRVKNPVNRRIKAKNSSEPKQMTLEFIDVEKDDSFDTPMEVCVSTVIVETEANLKSDIEMPINNNIIGGESQEQKAEFPESEENIPESGEKETHGHIANVLRKEKSGSKRRRSLKPSEKDDETTTITAETNSTDQDTEHSETIYSEPDNKPVQDDLNKITDLKEESSEPKELLFKQCKRCWCNDCRHNYRNEGIPRNFCGTMMACPACDECIKENSASICPIGDYEAGCELRGIEEGLFVPYNTEDI